MAPDTLDEKTLAAFKATLHGDLLLPAEPGYDEARAVWNAMTDRRPALIVRCRGAADVVRCIGFARERELPLSIKGGGHNIAGLAVADGGIMLDMSLMRGVWVDPAARTARAQAGCLLSDVDRETQLHGLAAVLGFISNTGIAGLTLGGGFGYLTRRFGWTTDNLLSVEIVGADGRLVRASRAENPDLFWGLSGGGGNFGVATSFEYNLHPVGPEVMAGAIAWRGEDRAAVLELFREFTAKAPPELACVAIQRKAPPAPWIDKEFHGRPVVAVLACHTGNPAAGEKLLAPLKSFGKPVGDIVQRRSYVSQQSLIDGTQPKGRRNYWKSEYLPALSADLLAATAAHAEAIASPHSAILLFPLGGALDRFAEDSSAAGNRNAGWVLNIIASWEKPSDDDANTAWARAAWEDLKRFSTGRSYVNFQSEDEGDARVQSAYGANYRRLAEIKAKWDPENLFRMNKNIRPAAK